MTGIDAVVIGRNEGARLVACLAALGPRVDRMVYVDSGSTDDSVAAARAAGALVVALDLAEPFTAARARNAGYAALEGGAPYVQFLDGDCVIRDGWLPAAAAFLAAHPEVAVVCGRRRERFPEVSVYNRLCDHEWDTLVGEATACGGDALIRRAAFEAVGGYRADLIAGEEPELCLRLRRAGWRIWRLDAEMTWHDAAMTRFGQWWRRTRRAGFAYARGAELHGAAPERHWRRETRRALVWGLALPGAAVVLGMMHPWFLAVLLAYPAQVLRLAAREGLSDRGAWERAVFAVLGKFPEMLGVVEQRWSSLAGRRVRLIEYK